MVRFKNAYVNYGVGRLRSTSFQMSTITHYN